MPSPTSRTRPTSRVSILLWYCSISLVRTETISSALNLIAASLEDLMFQGVDARTHGAVVNQVADLQLHAAQEIGVDLLEKRRLQVERSADLPGNALAKVVGQWNRGADQ